MRAEHSVANCDYLVHGQVKEKDWKKKELEVKIGLAFLYFFFIGTFERCELWILSASSNLLGTKVANWLLHNSESTINTMS